VNAQWIHLPQWFSDSTAHRGWRPALRLVTPQGSVRVAKWHFAATQTGFRSRRAGHVAAYSVSAYYPTSNVQRPT
ncbi:MAG: hypothetical protein J7M39_07450, partial [Anaerolineae bacterium]|nr:hypothetical protein [Anaerolineae bacterium]